MNAPEIPWARGGRFVIVSLLLFVLAAAAWAGPKDGQASRLARLVRQLSHPEYAEREQATEALIAAGEPALQAIRPLLDATDGETRYRARRVFHGIRGFSPATEQRIQGVAAALRKENGVAPEESMEEILEAGPAAIACALKVLERVRAEAAVRFRQELLVKRSLRAFTAGGRWGGPEALRGAGKGGIAVLERIALDGRRDPGLRIFALNSLRQVSDAALKETALRLLGARATAVRQSAVLHLAELAGPRDFERVAELEGRIAGRSFLEGRLLTEKLGGKMEVERLRKLLDDESAPVRAAAARVLGARGDRESRRRLKARLGDSSKLVRMEAARALGAIGEGEDADALGGRLGSEEDPEVVEECLAALSALGENGVPWLAVGLRHADAGVRRRAAVLAGRSGSRRTLQALVATLGDQDPSVEAAVLQAAGRLAGKEPPALLGVGTPKERSAAAQVIQNWWRGNEEEVAGKEKLLGALAGDGGRILREIEKILGKSFLSVKAASRKQAGRKRAEGEPESESGDAPPEVKPARLERVAVRSVRALLGEAKSPLPQGLRKYLGAAVAAGSFRDLGDVGKFLGSLPIEWNRKSYVELINRVSKDIVASLGDPFTRILISHDADGRFSNEIIPLLFGGSKTTGVILKRSGEDVLVDFVLCGSPAWRAGLRYGDQVVMIDGEAIDRKSVEEINEAAKGKASLAIFRQGWSRPFTFELEPEAVFEKEPVRFTVLPGKIGYLRLQYFGQGTDTKVEWALRELEKRGIRGLVFDLRNNPGGLVAACTNIVDKFLGEKKSIAALKPRKGMEGEIEIVSTASETDRAYPLVILVNRSSASASELMSGTLQDLKRSVIVGDRTYGKGIGQQGFMVSGFSGKSLVGETQTFYLLSVTTMKYFFPSGGNPQGIGVAPDREVLPASASGDRFTRLYRVGKSKQLAKYVEELAASETAPALARWDGRDTGRYPGFDAFYKKLRNPPSRTDARRVVRRALREKLSREKPDGGFDLADLAEDRVLRAGIEEMLSRLDGKVELDELVEKEWGASPEKAGP